MLLSQNLCIYFGRCISSQSQTQNQFEFLAVFVRWAGPAIMVYSGARQLLSSEVRDWGVCHWPRRTG